jgi:hypothetical protein
MQSKLYFSGFHNEKVCEEFKQNLKMQIENSKDTIKEMKLEYKV